MAEKFNDKLYQPDELLGDIYDAVYTKTGKFNKIFINVADLKMDRFKMTDYDLDTLFDTSRTKIQYVGKYPTGINDVEQIWMKRQGPNYMSTIRIIPYMNKKDVNDMSDPINVNQIIRTLLSELVVSDRTYNILLPIINVDVKGEDLIAYPKIQQMIDTKKFYSIEMTRKIS